MALALALVLGGPERLRVCPLAEHQSEEKHPRDPFRWRSVGGGTNVGLDQLGPPQGGGAGRGEAGD